MFREMRRKGQALGKEECEEILRAGRTGVLALSGDDGYPYPVPLNYVFAEGKLYFHCAKSGHKADAIARSDKAGVLRRRPGSGRAREIHDVFSKRYRLRADRGCGRGGGGTGKIRE